jgi:putative transposase
VVLSAEEIRQIVIMTSDWHYPVMTVANMFHVSPERVYQLRKSYRDTGVYPEPKKLGRPPVVVSPEIRRIIIAEKKKRMIGSRSLCHYLQHNLGIIIGERAIHRVLLEENLTHYNPTHALRRPPWIRYERENSLSAVHMDWHMSKFNGKQVCMVLDDASRMILAGGEFDHATAEISISLLNEAYERYLHIAPIREVVTDHGTQFYAMNRDANGEADHAFEMFCKEMNIHHILARVKHPQTNGKIERWFRLYREIRDKFQNIDEMILWYNEIRPHRSLDEEKLLTPKEAFYRKARGHIMKNGNEMFERILGGEDGTK